MNRGPQTVLRAPTGAPHSSSVFSERFDDLLEGVDNLLLDTLSVHADVTDLQTTLNVQVEVERGQEVLQVTEAEVVCVGVDSDHRPTPLLG